MLGHSTLTMLSQCWVIALLAPSLLLNVAVTYFSVYSHEQLLLLHQFGQMDAD